MKKLILLLIITCTLLITSNAQANGWATAGKILAGVAIVDAIFYGPHSMAGRIIGAPYYAPYRYSRDCVYYDCYYPCVYQRYYPACRDVIRKVPVYDRWGNFMGYVERIERECQ